MRDRTAPFYRPELEALEDRLPPGSLRSSLDLMSSHAKEVDDALFQTLETGALNTLARMAQLSKGDNGGNGNPGVMPPNSHPHGQTYGEWEASFWQWVYSLPADHHPLTDTAPVSTGQSGHVWFIGGTFAPTVGPGGEFIGQVTRDVTIPTGISLFFPIINVESSTLEGNGTTAAELSANSKYLADFIIPDSLFVQVDGQSLHNLTAYRSQSPEFTFGPLPANNLLGAPEGATSPSVSDGYHIMLAPLSAGHHTLHFGGELNAPPLNTVFIEDITYHITVTK